jgi:hypothetical protein
LKLDHHKKARSKSKIILSLADRYLDSSIARPYILTHSIVWKIQSESFWKKKMEGDDDNSSTMTETSIILLEEIHLHEKPEEEGVLQDKFFGLVGYMTSLDGCTVESARKRLFQRINSDVTQYPALARIITANGRSLLDLFCTVGDPDPESSDPLYIDTLKCLIAAYPASLVREWRLWKSEKYCNFCGNDNGMDSDEDDSIPMFRDALWSCCLQAIAESKDKARRRAILPWLAKKYPEILDQAYSIYELPFHHDLMFLLFRETEPEHPESSLKAVQDFYRAYPAGLSQESEGCEGDGTVSLHHFSACNDLSQASLEVAREISHVYPEAIAIVNYEGDTPFSLACKRFKWMGSDDPRVPLVVELCRILVEEAKDPVQMMRMEDKHGNSSMLLKLFRGYLKDGFPLVMDLYIYILRHVCLNCFTKKDIEASLTEGMDFERDCSFVALTDALQEILFREMHLLDERVRLKRASLLMSKAPQCVTSPSEASKEHMTSVELVPILYGSWAQERLDTKASADKRIQQIRTVDIPQVVSDYRSQLQQED